MLQDVRMFQAECSGVMRPFVIVAAIRYSCESKCSANVFARCKRQDCGACCGTEHSVLRQALLPWRPTARSCFPALVALICFASQQRVSVACTHIDGSNLGMTTSCALSAQQQSECQSARARVALAFCKPGLMPRVRSTCIDRSQAARASVPWLALACLVRRKVELCGLTALGRVRTQHCSQSAHSC